MSAPLVTVMREGSRRILAAVDRTGWSVGLRPGQAAAQAQASVPGLVLVEADPEADRAALTEIAGWCLRYAPVVQPDGQDGILIDVEGAAHLLGGEANLLADAVRRLNRSGVTARAALADTPGAAWALARYRAGTIAPPGTAETALAPLPIAGLRLDPETSRALTLLGIDRIGDLARFPRASLTLRFGPDILRRLDRASGRASDPLTPLVPETVPQATCSFAEPLGDGDGLQAALVRLAPELCQDLDRRRAGVRRLDAVFRRVDGQPLAIRVGTAAPSRDPAHLLRLLAERLPGIDPGFGIDEVTLMATGTEPLGERQRLAHAVVVSQGSDASDHAALAPLIDRLGVRLGASRVFRAAPVESRVPERSVRRIPPLSAASRASWPADLHRPGRLLDPPEPVAAIALVPDDPPIFFTWRRVRYIVRAADGPERVRGEWWRDDAEISSLRDYYRVEDVGGRRFWLFRDAPMADEGRWWMHGRFA